MKLLMRFVLLSFYPFFLGACANSPQLNGLKNFLRASSPEATVAIQANKLNAIKLQNAELDLRLRELSLASQQLALQTGQVVEQVTPADEEVCIKYRKNIGWSKGYLVMGHIIGGSDLNEKVGGFRFNPFSTYLTVFWGEDQASIFELPAISLGRIPSYDTEVLDQQGREWQIKQGGGFC